ncbi:MAG: hypothetical protein ACI8VL_001588 [Bacteroidia bacterium]|jgi:hypothetical protein
MAIIKKVLTTILLVSSCFGLKAQDTSAVTIWMEAMLEAIRNEEGRPTIHARNLFHASVVLYDAWAVYDDKAETYLLGKTVHGVHSPYEKPMLLNGLDLDSARNITINYAIYRFLWNRFNQYSSKNRTILQLDDLFEELGFDRNFRSVDYSSGSPAALGNYIAQCMIDYSVQDGSNEDDQHQVLHYMPVNRSIKPHKPGTNGIKDPNRWQPISVREYIDKRGFEPDLLEWNVNVLTLKEDIFLSPEWGAVHPFSLRKEEATINEREGFDYIVYNDPGAPPYIDLTTDSLDSGSEQYKWGFLLVALWSSHHDPADSVMIDISPGAIGPVGKLPTEYADYPELFDLVNGGIKTVGHKLNPYTNKPYEPNLVPRGDYSRVIAEYWVDGVNTYTPPGHWVKLLHDVSYHPTCAKKWRGEGDELTQLEWDVKAHLTMTGALHDAAISSWGAKGWYDYVRPISAIRLMAEKGQCSDTTLSNYHPAGLPIVEGKLEVVAEGDPLAVDKEENVGKMKMLSWRGPDFVQDQLKDKAGVGWILVENWWPYQRYSFVTPPFAGYTSGHSTFSIAAADVLGSITGDLFFPEGLAEFTAKKDEFLIFEDGPSQEITLQWATYREAAEETCLSRIWGGIHPPADDIQGRIAGEKVAKSAVDFAERYFEGWVE